MPDVRAGNYLAIRNSLEEKTGIPFTCYNEDFLQRHIAARLESLGMSAEKYRSFIDENAEEAERFSECLTVNYTGFFRDAGKYKALRENVLGEIVRNNMRRKTLSLWSAGCAAGEEPYSVVMSLMEGLGVERAGWRMDMLATDVNGALLERARSGVYPASQVLKSRLASTIFRKYFESLEQTSDGAGVPSFRVAGEVRERVQFRRHNLLRDPFPTAVDLILCRNVMIYMKGEHVNVLVEKFHEALKDGGYLVLGNYEALDHTFIPLFERLKVSGEYFYRKIPTGSVLQKAMSQRKTLIVDSLSRVQLKDQ
ncbi:MAG TPA: protein-glutamate O-methyltransferase CheR [Elusimicrobiota bacterium]|nr:protein-glutamate O-methyltransferase CheR [Elusimicrobiota bacterium]